MKPSPELLQFTYQRCLQALRDHYGPDENDVKDPSGVRLAIERDIRLVLEHRYDSRQLHDAWRLRKFLKGHRIQDNSTLGPWLYLDSSDKEGFKKFVTTVWGSYHDWKALEDDRVLREEERYRTQKQNKKGVVEVLENVCKALGNTQEAKDAIARVMKALGIDPVAQPSPVPSDQERVEFCAPTAVMTVDAFLESLGNDPGSFGYSVPVPVQHRMVRCVLKAPGLSPTYDEMTLAECGPGPQDHSKRYIVEPAYQIFSAAVRASTDMFDEREKEKSTTGLGLPPPKSQQTAVAVMEDGTKRYFYAAPQNDGTAMWIEFNRLSLLTLNRLNQKFFDNCHRSEADKEALTGVLRELERRTSRKIRPGGNRP